jgi:hypothetical protein
VRVTGIENQPTPDPVILTFRHGVYRRYVGNTQEIPVVVALMVHESHRPDLILLGLLFQGLRCLPFEKPPSLIRRLSSSAQIYVSGMG